MVEIAGRDRAFDCPLILALTLSDWIVFDLAISTIGVIHDTGSTWKIYPRTGQDSPDSADITCPITTISCADRVVNIVVMSMIQMTTIFLLINLVAFVVFISLFNNVIKTIIVVEISVFSFLFWFLQSYSFFLFYPLFSSLLFILLLSISSKKYYKLIMRL